MSPMPIPFKTCLDEASPSTRKDCRCRNTLPSHGLSISCENSRNVRLNLLDTAQNSVQMMGQVKTPLNESLTVGTASRSLVCGEDHGHEGIP